MKVIYSKPKGRRIKKGTFKYKGHRVPCFIGLEIVNYESCCLSWHYNSKKWAKDDSERDDILFIDIDYDSKKWAKDIKKWCCFGMNNEIRSVKSAISHLKKHDEIPKGTKMRLVSMYVGYDVFIVK